MIRVLVVDDDPDQRLLLRRLFAAAGFTDVLEAADGQAALEAGIAHQPDLVVLDLAMPVRSGVDVLPDLHAGVPGARIVVLSNFPRSRLGDLVRRRGAVGYVEKRVGPERLVREILVAAALAEGAAEQASTQLPADGTSPRLARRFVRSLLDPRDGDLVASVELLVSELVTNALVHASSSPRLDIHVAPDVVRIEVYDDEPELPHRRRPDVAGPGGRGLLLLDRLSSRWGADPHGDGKVVWFEVARPGSAR